MMVFVAVVFLLSLVAIVALFAIKIREERGARVLMPEMREAADREALHIKELLTAAQLDLTKLPPYFVHLAQITLHRGAIDFARLAQEASRRSHELADFVSHKHNFKRRETRSEFLKKMSAPRRADGRAQSGQEARESVEF